jgi:hypothetical protein
MAQYNPPEGLLDLLGLDNQRMSDLAVTLALTMMTKMEPVVVAWVNNNLPRMTQSLLDSMEPALFQWLSENAGPAVQSLLDDMKRSLQEGK